MNTDNLQRLVDELASLGAMSDSNYVNDLALQIADQGHIAVPLLIEAYQHASVGGQLGIMIALHEIRDPESQTFLETVVEERDGLPWVLGIAGDAIRKMLPEDQAVARILKDLNGNDLDLAVDAATELGHMGSPAYLNDLRHAKGRWRELDRHIDMSILIIEEGKDGVHREYRNKKTTYSRNMLAAALVGFQDRDLLPIYLELLKYPRKLERFVFLSGWHEWVVKNPQDRDVVLNALKDVVKYDSDSMCREQAIEELSALCHSGDVDIVEALERVVIRWRTPWQPWKWHEDWDVRNAALETIAIIKTRSIPST